LLCGLQLSEVTIYLQVLQLWDSLLQLLYQMGADAVAAEQYINLVMNVVEQPPWQLWFAAAPRLALLLLFEQDAAAAPATVVPPIPSDMFFDMYW
jgi:hypothetical protein